MMCDPLYMYMLVLNLGEDYLLWDKLTEVNYLKATDEDIYIELRLEKETLNKLKKELDKKKKVSQLFEIEIKTKKTQEVVMTLKRIIYIRKMKNLKNR